MESLLSGVVTDLLGRALSMVVQRYWPLNNGAEMAKVQRLQALLLRMEVTVEEAEGRHITNQAMLRQLHTLRQGMYRGHYALDDLRYRAHRDEVQGEVSTGRSLALSRFINPSNKRLFSPDMDMELLDAGSGKDLDKVLGDMREFVVFLLSYPRLPRHQPCGTHLFVDQVMFGRQMEKDTILSFLLRSGGDLGVLPIIGTARVGKSTLVDNVCLDDRVRARFSSIVFFTGDDLDDGILASLRGSGAIRHQNPSPTSRRESLVVIELGGGMDMDEETWRRLHTSAANRMAPGSKIILTSRSDKIAALGTTRALTLDFLPWEAYWYFFKAIAFGSTSPDEQPKLAALGMEIAAQQSRSFLAANMIGRLLRGNLSAGFWRKVLKCSRECTGRNVALFGEHQRLLLQKGRPVYLWTVGATPTVILVRAVYQECSPRQHIVPLATTQGIMSGSVVVPRGEFEAITWRSGIPPRNTYLASCVSASRLRNVVGKKRTRSRQHRV